MGGSNEMILAKELKPTQSKKLYASAAQIDMRSTNKLTTGCVEIAHAQATQPLQSQTAYRDADIKGTGRQDPANAFPEHAHIRQVGKTVAGFEYVKDAKKDLESVKGGPIDTPELLRTKDAGVIRSDIKYKKEMPGVTAMYKGYQTMDAAAHPVVTKGKHAADIVSDRLYKADYEDEKALIYYPVHISEGYEQVKKCKEAVADANYKTGLEDNKKGNSFKPTDTETYTVIKGHEAATKDRLYKSAYEAEKHKNKPLADFADAKIDTSAVHIAHAQATQPLQSQTAYRDADIKGTGRQDPANAFPEHAHIRQVGQTVAGFEYVKDAKKDLESVKGGPIDAPDLVRAKEAGVIRSDIEYKKEMPDVTAMYKGYQTMDAASHPVVTKGKKAAEIVSMRKYHEDYEDEKALIYYPVHISEGYEQVKKCKEATADANYKADLEDNKKGNSFKPTDTETYAVMKQHEDTKDRIYKSAYEAEKHKNKPLADSNEMQLARKLVEDTHDKYYK